MHKWDAGNEAESEEEIRQVLKRIWEVGTKDL